VACRAARCGSLDRRDSPAILGVGSRVRREAKRGLEIDESLANKCIEYAIEMLHTSVLRHAIAVKQ